MNAIPELVRRHAEAQPDGIFCTFLSGGNVETISFSKLYRCASNYAAAFIERGIGREDIVPIIVQHSPHLYYSFLGALLAGAIPTFMPFPSAKQRSDLYWADHASLFTRLEPRLIVTYAANLAAAQDALPDFAIDVLVVEDVLLGLNVEVPNVLPGLTSDADDVACLQHSSGTTGLKKGVMLTHRSIVGQIDAYASSIALDAGDRIVSWLPLYHDMGFIACFMTSMVRGIHLVALDPFEWVLKPSLLLDAIQRYAGTLCWLPNFAFSHIVRTTRASASYDLSSMRAFIDCSEPCKPATLDGFLERFSAQGVTRENLHVCYAMAENVFAVTETTLERPATVLSVDREELQRGRVRGPGPGDVQLMLSCGRPLEEVVVRVCDPDGAVVDADVVGEIYISSPFLFTGYYKQPDLTSLRLRDGWYATGDMGFMVNGELYLTGRVDDMLIINGRNYYAHEIEAIVHEIQGVLPGRSVALGIDDDRSDATALVVLAEHREPVERQDALLRSIRMEIQERLGIAAHAVVALEGGTLVKTTSGKISRVKNRELYLSGAFNGVPGER